MTQRVNVSVSVDVVRLGHGRHAERVMIQIALRIQPGKLRVYVVNDGGSVKFIDHLAQPLLIEHSSSTRLTPRRIANVAILHSGVEFLQWRLALLLVFARQSSQVLRQPSGAHLGRERVGKGVDLSPHAAHHIVGAKQLLLTRHAKKVLQVPASRIHQDGSSACVVGRPVLLECLEVVIVAHKCAVKVGGHQHARPVEQTDAPIHHRDFQRGRGKGGRQIEPIVRVAIPGWWVVPCALSVVQYEFHAASTKLHTGLHPPLLVCLHDCVLP
mmetsp:Transcript_17790/g.42764  ORF Transcript_17790/g.42764 Transcript_17790/m.42764 type:complete len:270 (+) Transcript_17790:1525-2334(+)